MNLALWITAALLAVAFLAGGAVKLILPKEKLPTSWGWADDVGARGIKAIGTLEVLAAIGLILPAVLDVAPVLVPVAAVGVSLLMLGAAGTHVRRREAQGVVVTVALLALAVFVVWGRFGLQPFEG